MFALEARKLFIHQKGWIVLLVALLLRMTASLLFPVAIDPAVEEFKIDYLTILAPFEGELTEESKEGIENLSQQFGDAAKENERALSEFFAGQLDESAYRLRTQANDDLLDKKPAFDLLFQQYAFAREAPESRFLLYTNGWRSLFQHNPYDFILYFALLLILVPVFLNESKNEMWDLLLSTKAGERPTVLAKLTLAYGLTLALLSASFLFDLGLAAWRYGLPHPNFPLQSISLFGTSTKPFSIAQAAAVLLGLRLIGGLWFASLILFLANFTRRYSATLMSAASLLVIPLILGTYQQNAYLAGPIGLLLGTPFLRGDEKRNIGYIGEKLGQTFKEWPNSLLAGLVLLALVMWLALSLSLLIDRSSRWRMKIRLRAPRLARMSTLFLMLGLLLSSLSCASLSGLEETEVEILFNSEMSSAHAWREYRVFSDYNSDSPGFLRLLNVDTGEETALLHLPLLKENEEFDSNFFAHDHLVYLLFRDDYNGENPAMKIYELNLQTFDLRPIYQKLFRSPFELSLRLPRKLENFSYYSHYSIYNFFLHRGKLYFHDSTYAQIKSLDLRNGQFDQVAHCLAGNYSFYGDRLYTIDNSHQLVWLDLSSGEEGSLKGVYSDNFILDGDLIFYQNPLEQRRLYAYSLSTEESWPISEGSVFANFQVSKDRIYFEVRSQDASGLYSAAKDGTALRLCLQEEAFRHFYAFPQAEGLLYLPASEETSEWQWFE